MYCRNCGKEVPDGNKFCVFCGAPMARTGDAARGGVPRGQTPPGPVQPRPMPSKRVGWLESLSKRKKILILILALEIIAAIVVLLLVLRPF